METIENVDFIKFKENVKKYIAFDDDIRKIDKVLKEKKGEKKNMDYYNKCLIII